MHCRHALCLPKLPSLLSTHTSKHLGDAAGLPPSTQRDLASLPSPPPPTPTTILGHFGFLSQENKAWTGNLGWGKQAGATSMSLNVSSMHMASKSFPSYKSSHIPLWPFLQSQKRRGIYQTGKERMGLEESPFHTCKTCTPYNYVKSFWGMTDRNKTLFIFCAFWFTLHFSSPRSSFAVIHSIPGGRRKTPSNLKHF